MKKYPASNLLVTQIKSGGTWLARILDHARYHSCRRLHSDLRPLVHSDLRPLVSPSRLNRQP